MILEEVDEQYVSNLKKDLEKAVKEFMSDRYGRLATKKEIEYSIMVRHKENLK